MIALDAYSELLHVLYSAPLQQEQWQVFLALVSKYTASRSGYFLSADASNGLKILAEGGWPIGETTISAYNDSYAQRDPFRASLFKRSRSETAIGVFTEEELLPHDGLLRTVLYRDLLGPANLRHGTFAILALSLRRFDAISVWRNPDEGPIALDSRHLLEMLVPHVQNALEIWRTLGGARQRQANAEAMADASPGASFVLGRSGSIFHCNVAAESLIRDRDAFAVANGRLVVCDRQSNMALSKLLIDVTSPSFSPTSSSRFLTLQRTSNKPPLQAMAAPLPKTLHGTGDLLLLVNDPESSPKLPDDALRALYRFTAAETEVASGLLMGYRAEEIACLRRVSASTVRQQIKSMLSKTGTGRQTEMMRLFMTLPHPPATL